jgi:hypothetical protein
MRRPLPDRQAILLAVLLLLLCAAGCGSNAVLPPSRQAMKAHVTLPSYPYVENDSIRIDPGMLDDLAAEFLAGGGRVDQVPGFLFSFVPVRCFDRIARGMFEGIEEQEGLLYLSGFFGGVWLKTVLDPGSTGTLEIRPPAGDSSPAAGIFSLLASVIESLNETVRQGEPEAIRELLFDSLEPFLFLYGYNLGYLESILERAPAGVIPPPGYLTCSHFLDCRTPVQGISVLEDLLRLVADLTDSPDERWGLLRARVEEFVPPAREAGYGVWSDHLSTEGMRPNDYLTLLDLSAGFLLYCQVLVLSDMDAWVNGEADAGRVSLAVGAAMAAWVGGYGIGLISENSGEDLPRIELLP